MPHSFHLQTQHGLTYAELVATPAWPQDSPCDVYCIVKHRMHILHLNSVIVLVLPQLANEQCRVPPQHSGKNTQPMAVHRIRTLRLLADTLENMIEYWGSSFAYVRAANALRQLVQARAGEIGPPLASWLGVAVLPCRAHSERHRQCILWTLAEYVLEVAR